MEVSHVQEEEEINSRTDLNDSLADSDQSGPAQSQSVEKNQRSRRASTSRHLSEQGFPNPKTGPEATMRDSIVEQLDEQKITPEDSQASPDHSPAAGKRR